MSGLPAGAGVPGTAQRLAVHRQRPLPAPGRRSRRAGQPRPQPGPHRGVEHASVDLLQHPADGGLFRRLKPPGQRVTADTERAQDVRRRIGDRGGRLGPGQHGGHRGQ